jgi:hypothetical protein
MFISPYARNAIENSPNLLYAPYVLAWLVTGIAHQRNHERERELKVRLKTDSNEYMTLLKSRIIITSVASTLCLLWFFYLSDTPTLLRPILLKYLPQASSKILDFLSNVPGWVVSGVIGNAAYRYFENARQRILNKSSKKI